MAVKRQRQKAECAARRAVLERRLAWILGAQAVFALAMYLLATKAHKDTPAEEPRLRNALIASTAVGNAAAYAVMGAPGIGAAAAATTLAATLPEVGRSPRYRRALGWANWLLPLSWPSTAAGFFVLVLDLAGAAITGNRGKARIVDVTFDWENGSLLVEGGWFFRPRFTGGFNLGQLSFITPGAHVVVEHELGHQLNTAAFGWAFHAIGGFDEMVLRPHAMHEAYAERLAESRRDAERDGVLRQWG